MKILIAGDTHANSRFIRSLGQKALASGCTAIIQLGDFGFTMSDDMMEAVKSYTQNGGRFCWLDGNHDDHDLRRRIEQNGTDAPIELREMAPGLVYLPRGCVFTLGSTKCMSLGGAVSIDKVLRVENVSWWSNETLSLVELDRAENNALQHGPVQILFSHDAPNTDWFEEKLNDARYKVDEESFHHRCIISSVMKTVKPTHVYHGHYHMGYCVVQDGVEVRGIAGDNDDYHRETSEAILNWNYVIREV